MDNVYLSPFSTFFFVISSLNGKYICSCTVETRSWRIRCEELRCTRWFVEFILNFQVIEWNIICKRFINYIFWIFWMKSNKIFLLLCQAIPIIHCETTKNRGLNIYLFHKTSKRKEIKCTLRFLFLLQIQCNNNLRFYQRYLILTTAFIIFLLKKLHW